MADRYWVGGTGNWDASTTTNWSASSGGAGGASVPTSSDNVIFDQSSSTANAAYTVTITATANCLDFTMDGPHPTDVNKVTWAGSSGLNIYGSLNISGGASGITRTYSGTLFFLATSTGKTITTNGLGFNNTFYFNSTSGGWTFQDDITSGGGSMTISLIAGTLDTNGKTVNCAVIGDGGSGSTKTLITGASIFNVSNNSGASFAGSNTTITAGTETWNFTGANVSINFNGKTVGTVNFAGLQAIPTCAAMTCAALTFTGSTVKVAGISFSGNVTVSGTLTINGNSSINRFLVKSSTLGTARTITAATVSVTNADFQDITGAGAGSWNLSAISGNSGDCGGNSGITFTSPVTTDWQSGTTWSTATWSSRVPLPQDTATFTTAGVATITQDMPRIGSVDFSTSSNKTWTTSTVCSVFGSINLTDLATLTASTQAYTFEGRGSNTLNSAGFTWEKDILINAPGATYTLTSNITLGTTRVLTATAGTLTVVNGGSNYVISSGALVATAGTLTLGSSTHLLTGVANSAVVFNAGVNATINAGTSTLKFTNTSNTAITGSFRSFTYNNIWFDRGASTGSITISGSNTFADFKDTGTVAHSILFTTGTSQTVTTFTVSGTVGNVITLNSTTTATFTLTAPSRNNASPVSCDYLNIQHCICPQANTWYAGANSVNNQAVATAGSGWIFTAPVIVSATNASFLFLMAK